jgi:hypothetical protein
MFNYPKIARNLYRTCMNYVQIINSGIKDIVVYVFEQASSLNSLFGYNESSLADSNDSKQKLYTLAKKDEVNFKPSLSGFNLDSSLRDIYYINPKDDISHRSILSGSNTDVPNITATQDGITWVDLNNVAVTTTFLVSATNTEVTGTVATFSGITAIVENLISTLNTITSASNTESSGVSSDNKGITRVPIDTVPYLLALTGSNTESKELSSDGDNLVRVPIDTISYFLALTGSNTESPSLSSDGDNLVRVPIDTISYFLALTGSNTESPSLSSDGDNLVRVPIDTIIPSFLLSTFNTETSGVYSLSAGITIQPIENGYPVASLSGFNILYPNLSTGNELVSSKNFQLIENGYPFISLSGFNILYPNLSTGNELVSSKNFQPIENGYPVASLSGFNILYPNLSTGNELVSSKNFQVVENGYPSINLTGIVSLSSNFLVQPIRYSDPDAHTYLAAVSAIDGQNLEIGIRNSITEFVAELKKVNLWDSITDCLILMGSRTLAGSLIPLKGVPPTPSGFNDSNYNRKRLKGNGTGFLNLNRFNNFYNRISHHVVIYKTEISTPSPGYLFGDGFGTLQPFINISTTGVNQHRNASAFSPTGNNESRLGFFGINRFQNNNYQFRFNNPNPTTLTSPTRGSATTTADRNLFLFKAGESGTPSNTGISFYSQGSSLDLALYQTLVDRLIYHLNAYTT